MQKWSGLLSQGTLLSRMQRGRTFRADPFAEVGESWASPAQRPLTGSQRLGVTVSLRSEGGVNSTRGRSRSSGCQDLPVSRRFMNAAYNCGHSIRTGPFSELENPNAVKRPAGDQPCGRIQLEISVEQWRKGSSASIDVFQQTSVFDWGD